MSNIIEVRKEGRAPSKVVIGDVLGQLESFLPTSNVVIISDVNIHRLYKSTVEKYNFILLGLGETNKTLTTVEKIYHELIALGVDRHWYIVGIGGGIVTDVAGFVASTYMRGVKFGFVATSLLAQVDASVGGKNGVNVEGYKNMVGTFNQPDFVLCDTKMLKTLPDREFQTGLAEIIKAGIIADSELFSIFETHSYQEIRENEELLQRVIAASVQVKADIVAQDEREAGERKKLNLGHTFAHAIEKCSTQFLHGEAVAIGLDIITTLSVQCAGLPADEAARVHNVLTKMGFKLDSEVDIKRLLKATKLDKKKDSATIDLILINKIGQCEIRKFTFEQLDSLFAVSNF